jgi:hypothetical protein
MSRPGRWAGPPDRGFSGPGTLSVTVTVTENLFKYELQHSPALPHSCPGYYADLLQTLSSISDGMPSYVIERE